MPEETTSKSETSVPVKLTAKERRSKAHLTPTLEERKQWTIDWKKKVQDDIAAYSAIRDKCFKAYKKQKDLYDGWLSIKMKKIRKVDGLLNNRKKVLLEIDKELSSIEKLLTKEETSNSDIKIENESNNQSA